MKNRFKIINIFTIICVFVFFINNFATGILYTGNQNTFGPGINQVLPVIPVIENTEKPKEIATTTIIKIATNSDTIYTHDGIEYVKGECVGSFSLSGYCACKKCGTGTGLTASGRKVRENHTIAADWNVLPKYTMIILENAVGKDGTVYDGVYQVEDRGGGIKNNKIDIYRPTHELAALVTDKGKCTGDVYIALPISTDSEIK